MHQLFVTEGIVLNKRPFGEANTLSTILTRDMGLVRAAARSTRVEQSKLRFGLEPLTHGRFTFVRGRHEWKLIGVEDVSRALLAPTASARRASGRVARLMMRLVSGEEPVVALYDSVLPGMRSLTGAASEEEEASIECVLVLRILSHLGYLPGTPELAPYVASGEYPPEVLRSAAASRAFLIRSINESLSHTGL